MTQALHSQGATVARRDLLAVAAWVWASPKLARAEAVDLTPAERALARRALALEAVNLEGVSDADLVARLLAYARRESGQRVRPERIDRLWAAGPPERDLGAEFRAARAGGRLAAWLAGLAPDTVSLALRAARDRYAQIVGRGGWTPVSEGRALKLGDRGPDVAALRLRLSVEDFGPIGSAESSEAFDAGLQAAVERYQAARALTVDGVVGPATRTAMNVPAEARLGQIEANLERRRWRGAPPPDRVEVDSGLQEVALFRGGSEVLRMRVVVGLPIHPTPMFRARIVGVTFNPPWNVPASIANAELLPLEARSPGTLARMGIGWVDGHLQQRPGPSNALGQIKLEVESPWGVYLHDTPSRALFAREVRAFSHGCIRLERPADLAAALLGESAASVADHVAAGATRRLRLGRAVPLLVVHTTCSVDAAGGVVFRPDIYGWDAKLSAALAADQGSARSAGGA